MQTIIPSIVNASPASQKRVKKIQWKVDNFHHIFDHGPAVVFSDEAKNLFLRSLVGKDSTVELTSGKSRLTLQTVGRVSRVHFHHAIGNGFDHFSVSYFSPSENLSFTEKDTQTREVIEHAVFGDFQTGGRWQRVTRDGQNVPPSILRINSGADLDALRAWSKSGAWALLGENGLRAKAIEKAVAAKKTEISRVASAISYGMHELDRKKTFPFNAEIDRARNYAKSAAENAEKQITARDNDLALVREMLASADTLSVYTSRRFDTGYAWHGSVCENEKALMGCGAQIGRIFESENSLKYEYAPRAHFPAQQARFTVDLVRSNYTVKRNGSGALVLSSNIVCPFDERTALAWLRGEGPAPSTRYGTCRKIETCTDSGAPLVLIGCGCHRIDVARDLGGEFADLLKPTHKAELIEGTSALELNESTRAEFLARCEVNAARSIAGYRTEKAAALARYIDQKTKLTNERDNLPALLAEMQNGIEKAKVEKAALESDLEAMQSRFPGAGIEKISDLARVAFSAFSLSRL